MDIGVIGIVVFTVGFIICPLCLIVFKLFKKRRVNQKANKSNEE